MIYPIGFSIPECKIVSDEDNRKKKRLVSNLIPGRLHTYVYDTEERYYLNYKESFFANTRVKGGWDCMRHYEILANGCIPWFLDIDKIPQNTMTRFPKKLVQQAMAFFSSLLGGDVSKSRELFYSEEREERMLKDDLFLKMYAMFSKKLLDYTREHLTTKATAKYILETVLSSFVENKKVLFLSGDVYPDYLRCLTCHGFKDLLGKNCHDFPKLEHLYTSFSYESSQLKRMGKQLYGKGFSYSNILDDSKYRNDELDKTISEDSRSNFYDLVVFGSIHRGLPFFDLIRESYPPEKIVYLCGEDDSYCPLMETFKHSKSHLFIREMF